ncbi:rhomboid family intramembrane serine protease [Ectobacillus funiculus]|uniref:rhomboid family intramembrane serine protease n=1 Tax=Ectobacillus funiculus TaxID=137993 RepID=UPI00101BCCD6|nr:rhomboid family intramembrane serine protease [Ectobacillus funiculus]
MHQQQDSLYWALLYSLVCLHKYEILHNSEEQGEAWLQSPVLKSNVIVRLKRHDVDWSSWVREDLKHLERMRAQRFRGKKKVYNIYVSRFEPLDDWQAAIADENSRVFIRTVFFTEYNEKRQADFMRMSLKMSDEEAAIIYSLKEKPAEALRSQLDGFLKLKNKQQYILNYARPFITKLFVAIQIVLFGVLEYAGGSTNIATLIAFGAKYNPLILQGEWWRFFTPMFLHIGLLHLLMNTVALYYVGSQVERILGNIRFLFVYLFAGFCGSLLSFVSSNAVAAGASGAIFGCFGALLYIAASYAKVFSRTMMQSVLTLIGINLLFGFAVPGIDNAGHIGGLIGGFLATVMVHVPGKKGSLLQKAAAMLIALLFVSILLFYSLHLKGNGVL